MSDIQRYTVSGVMTPVKPDAKTTTKWVKYSDHKKTIEAKDKEIERLNNLLYEVKEDKKHVEKCFLSATEKVEVLENMLYPPKEIQELINE